MMYYDSNPTPIYNDVLCANVVTTVNMLKILDNKKAANSCFDYSMEKIKPCGIGSIADYLKIKSKIRVVFGVRCDS